MKRLSAIVLPAAGCWLALTLSACSGGEDSPADGGGDGDGGSGVDADPGGCLPDGSGTVSGTVMGASVAPVVRAFQVVAPGEGVAIVLDEQAGTCGTPAATGEHLALLFCAAPTPGVYPLVGEQAFACPGGDAFALVEQNGPTDFAEGTGGSVTITAAGSDCVSGSYSASFDLETLAGSFDAVVCP